MTMDSGYNGQPANCIWILRPIFPLCKTFIRQWGNAYPKNIKDLKRNPDPDFQLCFWKWPPMMILQSQHHSNVTSEDILTVPNKMRRCTSCFTYCVPRLLPIIYCSDEIYRIHSIFEIPDFKGDVTFSQYLNMLNILRLHCDWHYDVCRIFPFFL